MTPTEAIAMLRRLSSLLVFVLSSPVLAGAAPPPLIVECRAPFARTAGHADIAKLYGKKNVTFEKVNRAEGEVVTASVLFAKDPRRRLEIEWHDGRKRRFPSAITIFGESNQWIGPLGIRNGMTIQEVEQRAGKPFKINGFGFDVAGAGHFEETALAKLPGGCGFDAHFDIEGGLPPQPLERFIGDVEIDSNDPDLLTLKPKLWIYTLTYPPPGMD